MRPEVTASTEATGTREAVLVARNRRSMPNGLWGMLLLIATEATLLLSLVATYFYLRFTSARWPQGAIAPPHAVLPLALTAGLLATMVPIALAVRSALQADVSPVRRLRTARALVLGALLAQGGYLAVQIVSYLDDLKTFSVTDNAYGSIYFTMLGAHHVHVAVGILFSLWWLWRTRSGLTDYRLSALRVIAFYWYFVAAIAVFVVLAQVSPS